MSTMEISYESFRTSQAKTPNAHISLALVGCAVSVRFGGIPGRIDSGARLRESLSVLAPLSTI